MEENLRKVRAYKAYEKEYRKAMRVCKRRKQSLSNIMEAVIDAIAKDKTIVAWGAMTESYTETIESAEVISQRVEKSVKK